MDKVFFITIFAVLGVIYTVVGYRASRSIKSTEDYFLAGRKLGLFALTVALIGIHLGGGAILGTSRDSYTFGLYGFMYIASICLGFLLLASGVASRLRSFNVSTTAELFELRYGSAFLRKFASLLSVLSLCGIFMGQIVGSRQLMMALGLHSEALFIFFWALIIGYTMLGGLRAIVSNDIFQLTFIVIIFCAVFIYEIFTSSHILWEAVSNSGAYFTTPSNVEFSRLFGIMLIPTCYALIEQDIAQVLFAAKNKIIAVKGAFLASIFMLFFSAIPIYFGMKTKIIGLTVPAGSNPLVYLFDKTYPGIVVALIAYGIFAAIISTSDTILCAIGSHCAQDFYQVKNKKNSIFVSRAVMLAVGIATFAGSYYFEDILGVFVGSYGIPVAALFIPLVISYFTDRLSRLAAYVSVFSGIISLAILKILGVSMVVPAEGIAMLISLVGYVLGTMIDKTKMRKPARTT